jgi:putative tryptophan/tyrosine transport system permease protein
MRACGKLSTKILQLKERSRAHLVGVAVILVLLGLMLAPSLARLSFAVWFGAVATGICFSFVAIGVYISFRVLNYPDLTIDGSFPLGASISASMIVAGFGAYFTLPVAVLCGALAGILTGVIATRLKINSLLASILTATALISINLRIMGRSNIPLMDRDTVFTSFAAPFRSLLFWLGSEPLARLSKSLLVIIIIGALLLVIKLFFDWFMHSEVGLAMRATGDNPQMIRSLGTNTDRMYILGLAISNGLVALSGSVFAQYQGFADINMGIGLIIAGLAAVILGETIFRPNNVAKATTAVIMGMIIYRIAIAAALSVSIPLLDGGSFRINPQDVKLATAVLVLFALWFTRSRESKTR